MVLPFFVEAWIVIRGDFFLFCFRSFLVSSGRLEVVFLEVVGDLLSEHRSLPILVDGLEGVPQVELRDLAAENDASDV